MTTVTLDWTSGWKVEDLPELFRRVSALEQSYAQVQEVIRNTSTAQVLQRHRVTPDDRSLSATERSLPPIVEPSSPARYGGSPSQGKMIQNELQQTFEKVRQELVETMDPEALHRELEIMITKVAIEMQDKYASEVDGLRTEVEELAAQLKQTSAQSAGSYLHAAQELTASYRLRDQLDKHESTRLRDEFALSVKEVRDETEAKMCAISAALAEELAGVEKKVRTEFQGIRDTQQKFTEFLENKVLMQAVEEARNVVTQTLQQNDRARSGSPGSNQSPSRSPFCPPTRQGLHSSVPTLARQGSPQAPVRYTSQPLLTAIGLNNNSSSCIIGPDISQNSSALNLHSPIVPNLANHSVSPIVPNLANHSVSRQSTPRDAKLSTSARTLSPDPLSVVRVMSPRENPQMISPRMQRINQQVEAVHTVPVIAAAMVTNVPPQAPSPRAPDRVSAGPRGTPEATTRTNSVPRVEKRQEFSQSPSGPFRAPLSARGPSRSNMYPTMSLQPTPTYNQLQSPGTSGRRSMPFKAPATSSTPTLSNVRRMLSLPDSRCKVPSLDRGWR